MKVRAFFPQHDLRRHIAAFPGNPQVAAVRGDIIVITDQDIAVLRVDKKIAIVQILVTVTASMQFTKSIGDAQCRANQSPDAQKMLLCEQEP